MMKTFEYNTKYKDFPYYRLAWRDWSSYQHEAERLDRLDDTILHYQADIAKTQAELTEAQAKLTKPLYEYAWAGGIRATYKNAKAERVHLLQKHLATYEEWLLEAEQEFDNLTELTEQNARRLHNAALALELEEQTTQKKLDARQAKDQRKDQAQQDRLNHLAELNANPIQLPDQASAEIIRERLQPTKPHNLATVHLNGDSVLVHLPTLRELFDLLTPWDTVTLFLEHNSDHATLGYRTIEHRMYPHVLVVNYAQGRGRARFVPAHTPNGNNDSVNLVIRPAQTMIAEQGH